MTSTTTSAPASGRFSGAGARLRTAPRALWRGRETDAVWVRPAWFGMIVVSAVLYVWNLGVNGWANAFYSAAVQAGATNWEAFLYGSSDAGNSITVDKPPAFLWVMDLSVRLFGLSSWSILLPEAVMGVVTVALVYAIVRRHFAPQAALVAGIVTALTPIAVLMFRFNNPDAMLVMLITLATYLTMRGIEDGRVRWVLWAGAAVGFAFLTKQLQAFLVLPALVGVYLVASPRRIGTRFLHLFGALGTLVVSAGWWVALVELVPASMRPYVGGSQSNSFLELTFGYNGLGRLTGSETGSVTGGGGRGGTTGGGMWGETGITRLFSGEFGTQIAWLLPAAIALFIAGIVIVGRASRTDGRRATLLLLGGTLAVTGAAFSFGAGIIHPYYSVALAPAIGGLVGAGSWLLWTRREAIWARIALAAVVLGSSWWAVAVMSEASDFLPWLRVVVLVAGVAAAALLVIGPRVRALMAVGAAAALVAGLSAPLAWSVDTTLTAHTGSLPTAGPAVAGGRGGFGGGQGGFAQRMGGFGNRGTGNAQGFGGFGGRANGGGANGFPGGTAGQGMGTAPGGTGTGTAPGGQGGTGTRTFGGGMGGLLGGDTTVASALITALQSDASTYRWAAATVGSQNAASYQLASGEAVMPIGGFNGSDPSPTLAEFEQYVADGKIHYFISSGRGIGQSNGGSSASSSIASWVESHFTAKTIGGVTVYDLSSGSTTASS